MPHKNAVDLANLFETLQQRTLVIAPQYVDADIKQLTRVLRAHSKYWFDVANVLPAGIRIPGSATIQARVKRVLGNDAPPDAVLDAVVRAIDRSRTAMQALPGVPTAPPSAPGGTLRPRPQPKPQPQAIPGKR